MKRLVRAVLSPLKTLTVWISATFLLSLASALPAHAQTSTTVGTLVRISTPLGPIDLALDDGAAPRTVSNFLQYVREGLYDGSFFHRLVPGFILQGGGFRVSDSGTLTQVLTFAPVVNEFSPSRSNLRGTVAMAKLAGDPNSATSQWFINLSNNSANLDAQNGGFTVFGRVLGPGMAIAGAIAKGATINASTCSNLGNIASALTDLPVLSLPANNSCLGISIGSLVRSPTVRILAARATAPLADRIFEYLEASFPAYVAPASATTLQSGSLSYRYYAQTNTYLGVSGDRVYFYAPTLRSDITDLGLLPAWLTTAAAAGY